MIVDKRERARISEQATGTEQKTTAFVVEERNSEYIDVGVGADPAPNGEHR